MKEVAKIAGIMAEGKRRERAENFSSESESSAY